MEETPDLAERISVRSRRCSREHAASHIRATVKVGLPSQMRSKRCSQI
jgi:hypothetical protein